jgi:hypothetical protein
MHSPAGAPCDHAQGPELRKAVVISRLAYCQRIDPFNAGENRPWTEKLQPLHFVQQNLLVKSKVTSVISPSGRAYITCALRR